MPDDEPFDVAAVAAGAWAPGRYGPGDRLGEGMYWEQLADSNVSTFVFCHAPMPARGAVSSNSPATAIANVDGAHA
jgi:hypothetical protein